MQVDLDQAPSAAPHQAAQPDRGASARGEAPPAGGKGKAGAGDWIRAMGWAVLLFALLRGLVVQVYGIQSGSMQPTLVVGDYVVVNNAVFGADLPFTSRTLPALRQPRVGDVVVYRPAGYEPARDHIKRIIGAPGDTVRMAGGVVYRNGARLDEPYARRTDTPDVPLPTDGPYNFQWQRAALPRAAGLAAYAPTRDGWGPLVVPAGRYLMLGDDRNGSVDSRHTGFVPRGEIRGKVLAVHWSSGPRGVRWSRIGTRP